MSTEEPEFIPTNLDLDTQQLKFLIDAMWALSPQLSQQISIRHHVCDVEIERQLQMCLGNALGDSPETVH